LSWYCRCGLVDDRAFLVVGMREAVMGAQVVTVNDVLDGRVALDLQCLDRIYLNAYVPRLQTSAQVVAFLSTHLGYPFPSPALFNYSAGQHGGRSSSRADPAGHSRAPGTQTRSAVSPPQAAADRPRAAHPAWTSTATGGAGGGRSFR
jgi:hypothetical protein